MSIVLGLSFALAVLGAYFFISMLLYAWFTDSMLDWMRNRGVAPKYGIIALYRLSTEDPNGEEGLAGFVSSASLIFAPLALLEFGLRYTLKRFRTPTAPAALA